MTAFIIVGAVMLLAAVALVVRPLLRSAVSADAGGSTAKPGKIVPVITAVTLPAIAVAIYFTVNTWWGVTAPQDAARAAEVEAMIAQLEERLRTSPDDVEGWVMLGRSYVMLQRYPRAVEAYQQAYDRAQGDNLEATMGLAEALVLTDPAALAGKGGELIESALARAPRDPKALWYGSLAALQSGRYAVARDRMRLLLAMNPPEQVRTVLEQQLQQIEASLGGEDGSAPAQGAPGRSVRVNVAVAPELAGRMERGLALFVLARRSEGGPPLAVVRRSSDELPLTVELSDNDAMLAGQDLSSTPQVQIVARISRSGTPQAQSGDLYGEVEYATTAEQGNVNIIIDRIVP